MEKLIIFTIFAVVLYYVILFISFRVEGKNLKRNT